MDMEIAAIPSLGLTFGALMIGVIISTLIYGSTVIQILHYFRTFSDKDSFYFKSLVFFALIMDTAELGFLVFIIYDFTINHWGDVSVLSMGINGQGRYLRLLAARTILVIISVPTIQLFWIWRFWKISTTYGVMHPRIRLAIILFLCILVLGEFASALLYVTIGILYYYPVELMRGWISPSLVLLVITDIATASGLSFAFKRSRFGIPIDTLQVLNRLTIYTLGNGVLISSFTLATLITFLIDPDNWSWMAVFFYPRTIVYQFSLGFIQHEAHHVRVQKQPLLEWGLSNVCSGSSFDVFAYRLG